MVSVGPLYFSRVVLRRDTHLRDLHSLHRVLWKAWHDQVEERCFLFRADVLRDDESLRPVVKVLGQSSTPAEWEKLADRVVEHDQKQRTIDLREGDELRFFLRANPTIARKDRHELGDIGPEEARARRGHRVAVWGRERQEAWLRRKGGEAGFEVLAVRSSNARPWRWSHGGNHARHDGVDFEGVLRVCDAMKMAEAVRSGVGPAKAFGFGLLSLAPATR